MSARDNTSLPFADIYIDESSQNQHRFLVIGGVIIPQEDIAEFLDGLRTARLPELPAGEMKWGKVSRTKLPAYKRIVDLFFSERMASRADFHSIVVDTTRQKHAVYNQGSREIGFNKEVYQLGLKFGRLYPMLFHVYPDYRNTDQSLEELRLILNRGIRKKGDTRDWPYRRIQFRDSRKTPILQVADIFSGALAFIHNGHDKAANASPAKAQLAAYILGSAGISDPTRDTAIRGRFTIWHRVLR